MADPGSLKPTAARMSPTITLFGKPLPNVEIQTRCPGTLWIAPGRTRLFPESFSPATTTMTATWSVSQVAPQPQANSKESYFNLSIRGRLT